MAIYTGNIMYKKRQKQGEKEHLADGEGFEPPVELPPQRFSRPSQSTALPPILNFFTDGLSNLRLCSLTAPGGAAHHSFALDCADACLADSYARPSQSTTLPPILNFFTDGLSNLRFCSLTATQRCRHNVTNARIIQYWGRVVNSSVGGKLLRLRTCGYMVSLSPRREPT